MLVASIDIETTGLDLETCDILQFAAVLDDLSNPVPLQNLPKFEAFFTKRSYSGHPYAMSMHSEMLKKIDHAMKQNIEVCPTTGARFMPLEDLPTAFASFLLQNGYNTEGKGKIYVNVAGKNVAMFDLPWLKAKIKDWGPIYFLNRVIDPAILYFDVQTDSKLPDMSKCLERAGLSGDVPHTALEDALIVLKLLRKKLHKN